MDLVFAASLGILAAPIIDHLSRWLPQRILDADERWFAARAGTSAQFKEAPDLWVFLRHGWLRDGLSWLVLAAAVLVCVGLQMGLGWELRLVAALVFAWSLLALAAADIRMRLLPDALTLALVWLGLVLQLHPATRTVGPELAIAGAALGYLPLRLFERLFFWLRRAEGLGFGDMKLMAAVGAWMGPAAVAVVFGAAAVLAALWQGALVLRGRAQAGQLFAFGPWIVLAALVFLLAAVSR